MQRLDNHPIPIGTPECRVSVVMRNEGLRLPYLLDYYRKLGANRFFIIDNGSTDGGREFVLTQPDCHVFLTDASFGASRFGAAWHQEIIEAHGENHWWVLADTDELLVYPDCENIKLPAFCRALDAEGATGVYALMLDMYSQGSVAKAECIPGKSFIETCPCFDTDYVFRPRLAKPFGPKAFPPLEPVGGPRQRVFYPEFAKAGPMAVAITKVLRKLRDALKKFGIKTNLPNAVPPMLFKIPLFKYKPGLQVVSSHIVTPLTLSTKTAVLLHFKFFADFHARAMKETQRGEHFDGASEYGRYLRVLENDPGLSFYHDKSAHYSGSSQLVALGLMKV